MGHLNFFSKHSQMFSSYMYSRTKGTLYKCNMILNKLIITYIKSQSFNSLSKGEKEHSGFSPDEKVLSKQFNVTLLLFLHSILLEIVYNISF